MKVFTGKGQCSTCHAGAELTNAATAAVTQSPLTDGLDTGFENIGVRDPKEEHRRRRSRRQQQPALDGRRARRSRRRDVQDPGPAQRRADRAVLF